MIPGREGWGDRGRGRFETYPYKAQKSSALSPMLVRFSDRLSFPTAAQRDRFLAAFDYPPPLNPSILWCQNRPETPLFPVDPPEPWQPPQIDRLRAGEQPGKHPAHDRGWYYCLDFSSVFAASPLLSLPQPIEVAIDVCAAPGGKTLFTCTTLHPQWLLSNEVIGKRLGTLLANLKRCQPQSKGQIFVTQLDSQILAQQFPQTAQLVLVDAPCSGQSLLLKHKKVPGCFHPLTLNRNANRQKRIIGNCTQLVAPGGYLLYMTCTYSVEENEQVCQWLQKKHPHFQPVKVPHLLPYQSHLADFPCYRLWPDQGLGAGGFTALFQNTISGTSLPIGLEVLATINRF